MTMRSATYWTHTVTKDKEYHVLDIGSDQGLETVVKHVQ